MPESKTLIEEIRNEINNINYTITKNETNDFIYLTILFDDYKFPVYQRNRSSRYNTYDPLSKWKSCFHNRFDEIIKEYIEVPYEGYIDIDIKRYIKAPKKFMNNKKKKEILSGTLRPRVKPDNDNIEKLIFDLFNKIIYLDDNQIVDNATHKYYSFTDKTIIDIKITK